jgi:hypothetical protein
MGMEKVMKCPVCDEQLSSTPGDSINPRNGITVFCPNAKCSAQEVTGHGRTEQEAFEIIKAKYIV